jgi:hypothetical protein
VKPINKEIEFVVGMALATKDGQRIGNAFIVDKEVKVYEHKDLTETYTYYHIVSDFGNKLTLTHNEIAELFDVADWWWECESDEVEFGKDVWFELKGSDHKSLSDRIERQLLLLNDLKEEYCGSK